MAKLLIHRDEHIELPFSPPEQLSVLDAGPSRLLDRPDGELAQSCLNDMGDRFVEKDLQADFANFRSVALENSRT